MPSVDDSKPILKTNLSKIECVICKTVILSHVPFGIYEGYILCEKHWFDIITSKGKDIEGLI